MEIVPLAASTSMSLVRQIGELYKLVSPEYEGTAVELGQSMQSAAVTYTKQLHARGLEDKLPPIYYLATEADRLIGYGHIQVNLGDELPMTSYCFIFVHPDDRRKGVGSVLLQRMKHDFERSNLSSIFFFAEDSCCRDFLLTHGGTISEYGMTYEMELTEATMLRGIEEFSDHLQYSTLFIQDPVVEDLGEFIQVYNIAKVDEPRSSEDPYRPISAENYHKFRTKYADMYVVGMIFDLSSREKRCVGVTDIMETGVEGRLFQRFTGVLPEYRGRGVAKMLKTMMLDWIRRNKSEMLPVKIETSTRNDNVSMRRVNEQLGYYHIAEEITIEFFND